MTNRITLSLVFSLCAFYISAQDAIKTLKKQYASDAAMVKRINTFEADGYSKKLDYGLSTSDMFIDAAKQYLGTPYKFGGMSRSGIDCSGLIVKTMGDLGIDVPHSAQELARYGEIILDKSELRPGDIIFFTKTYNTQKLITHAGFVVEDDQMLHASSKGVNISALDDPYYWNKYYLFGTRIFDQGEPAPMIASSDVKETDTSTPSTAKMEMLASIYDVKYRGKITDSGEAYDKKDFTASHESFAFGTILRVTNLENGRTVEVRVNDGDTGRDDVKLTLSKKAARSIRLKKGSKANVSVEVVK